MRINYKLLIRLASIGIPLTSNHRKLRKLKNKHKGQRCFIIGNGPSLKIEDLQKIHENGDISFASNKIYLAFDQTDWRPTYYSVYDLKVAENNYEAIRQLKLHKIFGSFVQPYFAYSKDITFVVDLPNPIINNNLDFQFSTNLLNGAFGGYTVIQMQLQLAYYMGIRRVYLIGLDFSYSTPKATNEKSELGEVLLVGGEHKNHFHPDYRKPEEKWTMPQLEFQRKAFTKSKLAFEADRRIVVNASRCTALDVFPLKDFDSLFNF